MNKKKIPNVTDRKNRLENNPLLFSPLSSRLYVRIYLYSNTVTSPPPPDQLYSENITLKHIYLYVYTTERQWRIFDYKWTPSTAFISRGYSILFIITIIIALCIRRTAIEEYLYSILKPKLEKKCNCWGKSLSYCTLIL